MTKSQMFKKAHEIARATKSIAGSYRIAFACALKDLYNGEITMEQKQNFISYLEEQGLTHWTKKGDRIYLTSGIIEDILEKFDDSDNLDSSPRRYMELFGWSILSKNKVCGLAYDVFFDCEKLAIVRGGRNMSGDKMVNGISTVCNELFDCTVNPNAPARRSYNGFDPDEDEEDRMMAEEAANMRRNAEARNRLAARIARAESARAARA